MGSKTHGLRGQEPRTATAAPGLVSLPWGHPEIPPVAHTPALPVAPSGRGACPPAPALPSSSATAGTPDTAQPLWFQILRQTALPRAREACTRHPHSSAASHLHFGSCGSPPSSLPRSPRCCLFFRTPCRVWNTADQLFSNRVPGNPTTLTQAPHGQPALPAPLRQSVSAPSSLKPMLIDPAWRLHLGPHKMRPPLRVSVGSVAGGPTGTSSVAFPRCCRHGPSRTCRLSPAACWYV